ncbi:AAA family ATPase, partial [Streptomyces sp. NRRL S-118]|uniref:AAA family ATPase n=1 Tax=Streptomyces sp. NRRL S-118 TaxID=1463881 RepID=UPI00131BC965
MASGAAVASGAAGLRDLFAARLREELRTGQERGAPAVADARRTYRRAAALLSRFDPQRLRLPDAAGPAGYATLELLDDCTAVGGRASGLWTLKPSVREEVLAGLDGPGTALRLLECNAHQFADEPGPEQVCLAHLSGRPPDLARQSADELADTLQAVLWLSRVPGVTGLPDSADVTRALDRARLLEPLERLAQGPFLGRTGELRALGAYTGLTAAPAGPEGPAEPGAPTGPLVVHGPGGIGKSTLLARFLLDGVHHLAPGFPFAYIDYERPTLSVHEPITLIAEMARQLGVQYPSHRADLEALADECQEVAGSEREGQERVSQLHRLATTRAVLGRRSSQEFHLLAAERETALMRGVAEVMSRAVTGAGQAGAPFVLVLDSFEEAQYRASPVLGRLWSMYTALCSVYPRTRVLVSGRAPVGHPAQTVASHALELPELPPEAAVGLLESCGVADPELARLLADRVGGHPLSLKLAARAAVLAEAAATAETVP